MLWQKDQSCFFFSSHHWATTALGCQVYGGDLPRTTCWQSDSRCPLSRKYLVSSIVYIVMMTTAAVMVLALIEGTFQVLFCWCLTVLPVYPHGSWAGSIVIPLSWGGIWVLVHEGCCNKCRRPSSLNTNAYVSQCWELGNSRLVPGDWLCPGLFIEGHFFLASWRGGRVSCL
jgi:hypothetical protein